MSRIRTIKPELFRHEVLFEAEVEFQLPLRIAFAGLFTCCDKEGRFRWRPRQLKLDILPYDDVDFSRVLDALATRGFIVKYEVNHEYYGCIPSWKKHQHINGKEMDSTIPPPAENSFISLSKPEDDIKNPHKNKHLNSREARVSHASSTPNPSGLNCPGNSPGEGNMEKERNMEYGTGRDERTEPLRDSMSSLSVVTSLSNSVDKNSHVENSFVIRIPLNNKTEFTVTDSHIEEWKSLYPAVDILEVLQDIRDWNLANPKRRKTKSGIAKHIMTWLAKEQKKSAKGFSATPSKFMTPHERLEKNNLDAANKWLQSSTGIVIEAEKEIHPLLIDEAQHESMR